MEVLEDADCELGECADELSKTLHVEQERAREERVKRLLKHVQVGDKRVHA